MAYAIRHIWSKGFYGPRGRGAYLNGAIDPHGITLAGNLKVDCRRRFSLYALCFFYGGGIHSSLSSRRFLLPARLKDRTNRCLGTVSSGSIMTRRGV